jgi:ribosomal-protein-alanine N-acetyltransferase
MLRAMTLGDIARVSEIDAVAFGNGAWPRSAFRDELHANHIARYFVLDPIDDRPLLGYVGCWALFDTVHLVTIGVDPRYQRQGLGEILVRQALDLAHEIGAPEVTLECRESNARALALYRKYGFEEAGRRPRYYSDTREAALIMTADNVCSDAFRAALDQQRADHDHRYGLRIQVEGAATD